MDYLEDDGAQKGVFSWESRYTQSWDVLKEDEDGSLATSIVELTRAKYLERRRKIADKALRRGIMRHLLILLDLSKSANETDYQPTRGKASCRQVQSFSHEYFEQNPVSQLGIVGLKKGLAERIVDLSGGHKGVFSALSKEFEGDGDMSIRNGLEVAKSMLFHTPSHETREVLIILSGVSTSDVGDIQLTVDTLKKNQIQVSCVSLSGEINIIKRITSETGGSFSVALDEEHLSILLKEFVIPPMSKSSDSKGVGLSYLVPMGFPGRHQNISTDVPFCACHGSTPSNDSLGFVCPRCKARVCQVPSDCPVCQLTLITAPHLAKTYHHLFPVATFVHDNATEACFACGLISDGLGYNCCKCFKSFCSNCEQLVHESLFSCPGCIEQNSLNSINS